MKKEIRNLKELVSVLQEYIETFSSPKEKLEQYQTSPEIAGEIAHCIKNSNIEINQLRIADLGCGTGILGISLALCGCEDVTLFDIDEDAINIAKDNVAALELEDKVQLVLIDVRQMQELKSFHKKFDLVITNPPFGIRSKKGYDLDFLKSAINICKGEIFSIHKLSTLEYLKKFYKRYGINDIKAYKLAYDLPKSYKFQKKQNKTIEVVYINAKVNDVLCLDE